MATPLFGAVAPEFFGGLGGSLFQVMTVEDWPEHLSPLCYQQEKESRHHDAIVNQTIGEGLQAYRLEKLSRYETVGIHRRRRRPRGMTCSTSC